MSPKEAGIIQQTKILHDLPSSATGEMLSDFRNPPRQFSPIPFWWWVGDQLDHDRLAWQLDQLVEKGVYCAIISYNHLNDGILNPGSPPVFSPQWWEKFRWVVEACKTRGMTIGFQDYAVVGPLLQQIGLEFGDMRGGELLEVSRVVRPGESCQISPPAGTKLLVAQAYRANSDGRVTGAPFDVTPIDCAGDFIWMPPDRGDLSRSQDDTAPSGDYSYWLVSVISVRPNSFDPMHPESGKRLLARLYEPFETHCPGELGKTISVFFQDELDFGSRMPFWSDQLCGEFQRRKGYNLMACLPALWHDVGDMTVKLRIDYSDVVTALMEEHYFKPIYQWHRKRGILWGNDNSGRGRVETGRQFYGDYFRTMRWFSAPGTDDPNISAPRAFRGLKVNSSIAHLYGRDRVWVECFHSSGWGVSPADIVAALNQDFVYGANLVNLHGLYYSTHGSWWEWASPDFHFRQPYWRHIDGLNTYIARLCYVLSQGVHRCDVAIVYPITAIEGGLNPRQAPLLDNSISTSEHQRAEHGSLPDASESAAFDLGRSLFDQGIDFDFVDFESLELADCTEGVLHTKLQQYRVLILPVLTSIRYSTLLSALDFVRAGGLVIAFGSLPMASERMGSNDPKVNKVVEEIFGPQVNSARSNLHTFNQTSTTAEESTSRQKVHNGGGAGIFISDGFDSVVNQIRHHLVPDFYACAGQLQVLHRICGEKHFYLTFNPSPTTYCENIFFRVHGAAETWNAWSGEIEFPLVTSISDEGTTLSLNIPPRQIRLIVFQTKMPSRLVVDTPKSVNIAEPVSQITLSDKWKFTLRPTMDNRFGDFRLPPEPGFIGPEARRFKHQQEIEPAETWHLPEFDDSKWPLVTASYGPRFYILGPLPPGSDLTTLEKSMSQCNAIAPHRSVKLEGKEYHWRQYDISLRWGVENDAFLRNWASGPRGLKGRVPDEFIDLNCDSPGSVWYLWTSAQSPSSASVLMEAASRSAYSIWLNGLPVLDCPEALPPGILPPWNLPHYSAVPKNARVHLSAGDNSLMLKLTQSAGQRVRAYVAFDPPAVTSELILRWFNRRGGVVLNPDPGNITHAGWYRFTSPPGLKKMTMVVRGKPRVWVDGVETELLELSDGERPDDARRFCVILPEIKQFAAKIAMRVEQTPDSFGGDTIVEPVLFDCTEGQTQLCEWARMGLECYSGVAVYGHTFEIDQNAICRKLILDLGNLASTARIRVNGQDLESRVQPPWQWTINSAVKVGVNDLEIEVANTLGNHYSVGIPTPYTNTSPANSGLFGPVKILEYAQTNNDQTC